MHRVFVYGSLMRGFGNHGLLQDAHFITEGVGSGLRLYTLGGFPACIDGADDVRGEVYEVDEETLARLDRLEGHPTFYERQPKEIWAENLNAHLPCEMYIYQGNLREDDYLPNGSWRHHRETKIQGAALRR